MNSGARYHPATSAAAVGRVRCCRTSVLVWATVVIFALSPATPVQAVPDDDCTVETTVLPVADQAVGGELMAGRDGRYGGAVEFSDGSSMPALWSQSETGEWSLRNLGPRAGWKRGYVMGLDSKGDILVTYDNAETIHRASFLFHEDTWTGLLGSGGNEDVGGMAVASDGTVVGTEWLPGDLNVGVIWPPGTTTATRLSSSRPTSRDVVAVALNDRHDIVGSEHLGPYRSLRWGVTIWPTAARPLPGPVVGGTHDQPQAINRAGRIVGWYYDAAGTTRAFVADPFSSPSDLGAFPGDVNAGAYAVNDAGAVAGDSGGDAAEDAAHAFVWPGHGPLLHLTTQLPYRQQYDSAYGLDDQDHAWGVSRVTDGGAGQPTLWSCVHAAQPAPAQPSPKVRSAEKPRSMAPRPPALRPPNSFPR